MTDDRDFLRATEDWLEAGSDGTPPAAINAVLLAVRTTRQDRPLPVPWRSLLMPSLARVMVAAAAVVAIAFAWFTLAPRGTDVGGVAVPSAGPTLSPSPSPTPIPIAVGNSTPGSPLIVGARYTTADPFPVRLSFTAPAGWTANIGGEYATFAGPAATGDSVRFELSPQVYADPCHPEQGFASESERDTPLSYLADRIVSRPGLVPSTPVETSLGGLPATSFTLELQSFNPADCTDGRYVIWRLPLGATNELQGEMSERVWVIPLRSDTLVVTALAAGRPLAEQEAIQQLLDSMTITS